MIFKLKTWYKNYGNQGSNRGYLTFRLETDNIDFRNSVQKAIQAALHQAPAAVEKSSAIGFHNPGQEDQ